MTWLIDGLAAAGKRRTGAAAGQWPQSDSFDLAMSVLAVDYSRQADDGAQSDRLARLATTFGLDAIDAGLLWSAVAPDLDASISVAYGALRGQATPAALSVALGLELSALPSNSGAAFARLSPTAPLRRHGLLTVADGETWLTSTLRAPHLVTAGLAGADPDDPLVTGISCELTPLALPGGDRVCRALAQGESLVWVQAGPGTPGASLAAGAVAAAGLSWLSVDARRCRTDRSEAMTESAGGAISALLARAARTAGLAGHALIVVGGDRLAEAAAGTDPEVFTVLAMAAAPVIVVATAAWQSGWLPHRPLVVTTQPLSAAERVDLWRQHLGEVVGPDPVLRQTLAGLRLSPEDVTETARYARLLAGAQGRQLDAGVVREAARQVGGSGSASAERMRPDPVHRAAPTFADLVLPDRAIAPIRQLVSWALHRNEVPSTGALRRSGTGLTALFAGNAGTGKTLAAHVVAAQLSMDLFQVDLAGVIDKYIGETEKNLERVFRAAESLDVVLFFDEADALFGSRTEVSDARDRYANQEVAYLLQRMEQFDGITILATNLRSNLDRAFSRRMNFIVNFPDPDAPTRRRLWLQHLAEIIIAPDDPVQVDRLSDQLILPGGDIRNIVLAATYDAVTAGEQVGMRHVVAAAASEYQKLSRVPPEEIRSAPERSPTQIG